jgi:ribosome-associated toxin RatA of RatAB toxin-antitoxin module
MPLVHKTVLLAYSAQQMFDLVRDIDAYPQFLPWCGGARIVLQHPRGVDATIDIDFRGLRHSFTTHNEYREPQRISMSLLQGPFSRLEGLWKFRSLRSDACKVEFSLDYAFNSGLLGQALAPVFDHIAASMVDAFVKRAESIYG